MNGEMPLMAFKGGLDCRIDKFQAMTIFIYESFPLHAPVKVFNCMFAIIFRGK